MDFDEGVRISAVAATCKAAELPRVDIHLCGLHHPHHLLHRHSLQSNEQSSCSGALGNPAHHDAKINLMQDLLCDLPVMYPDNCCTQAASVVPGGGVGEELKAHTKAAGH